MHAAIGRGKYEIRDDFKCLEVSEEKWFQMTKNQKEKHMQKFGSVQLK